MRDLLRSLFVAARERLEAQATRVYVNEHATRKADEVLHYDISEPTLEKARERAAQQGIGSNLSFARGSLQELEKLADRGFDLGLCLDAPISYTYPDQASVLRQLARVARSVPGPVLRQLLFDPERRERFLDLCHDFDSRLSVAGLGKDNLVASARRAE